MENKILTYENKTLELNLNETNDCLTATILQSFTQITNEAELNLLTKENDDFLPVEITHDGEEIHFTFALNERLHDWSKTTALTKVEKLQLLLNVFKFSKYIDSRYTCILDPQNLFYDDSYLPKMMYRGIINKIEPFNFSETEFLLQYKSLIVTTMNHKYQYESLYKGDINLVKNTQFFRDIVQADSLTELEAIIAEAYYKEKSKQQKSMQLVKKTKHAWYGRIALFSSILAAALAVVIIYQTFFVIPYQNQLFKATESFLIEDHNATIQLLEKEKVEQLPQSTKYQLAHSYIQNEPLLKEQKTIILNSLSFKSSENYLLFWIYTGKGEQDKALDIAKALNDTELLIYATQKKLDILSKDTTLSGSEKEELRSELTTKLEEYIKNFEEGISTSEETTTNNETTLTA